MISKLAFLTFVVIAAFSVSVVTPVLAQNMTGGNMTGGNMTGGMMQGNMSTMGQDMSTARIPKG